MSKEYTKASVPELVDLKITDYCDKGCNFCYQGSTNKGKHANIDVIKSIITELAEHQVFEIAIGGGEPTTHPNFLEILQFANEKHIVPNFTSRSFDWIRKGYHKDIMPLVGKVGFSIDDNEGQLEDLAAWTRVTDIQGKFVAHVVLGVTGKNAFNRIINSLKHHHMSVLFLDFKDVGRGPQFKATKYSYQEYDWFPEALKEIHDNPRLTVGIDTPLAKRFEKELRDMGISNTYFSVEEGKFSCYIDAVNQTIARSSYETEDAVALGSVRKGGWIDIYRGF